MIPILKDKDEMTLNGKQLREFAKLNYDSGKQAEQKRILKIIDKWWRDDKTCSGRPHCCIKECDLCVNCFDELKKEVEK